MAYDVVVIDGALDMFLPLGVKVVPKGDYRRSAMSTTNSMSIDPSNSEQLRAWDGEEGEYWAAHPEYFDRSIAEHHRRLLSAASIADDEHVLDIGCGAGQTT